MEKKRNKKWILVAFAMALACNDKSDDSEIMEESITTTMSLSANDVELTFIDETDTLSAIVSDQNGVPMDELNLRWTTSNGDIVVVDNSGIITAINNGSATITVSINELTAEASVVVSQVPAAIDVDCTSPEFAYIGETNEFSAVVFDAGGTEIVDTYVEWEISDETVAIFSNEGEVMALSNGATSITAFIDSVVTDTNITVDQLPSTIAIEPSLITLSSIGDSQNFSVTVWDYGETAITNPDLIWTSSDEAVAVVSSDGTVTAEGNGSTTIIATAGSVSEQSTIVVEQTPSIIEVNQSSVGFSYIGESSSLISTVLDANGNQIIDAVVVWTSSDDEIATVNSWGEVVAISNGSAIITAEIDSLSADTLIDIEQVEDSLTVNPTILELSYIDEVANVYGTVSDFGGTEISNSPLFWTSSDNSVASVSTTGEVTAVSEGTAIITGTFNSLSSTLVVEMVESGFYPSSNGITILCPDANVGDSGVVFGVTYTKQDRNGLETLVAAQDWMGISTSCTSDVNDLSTLFENQSTFNHDIGSWDTSLVLTMNSMFKNASTFNQNIDAWDTSSVTDMSSVFEAASNFNQPVGNWNVDSVTDMSAMFYYTDVFNQSLANWNVSNVTDMGYMFNRSLNFNQYIGGWNVGNVTTMYTMFTMATSFNQDIGSWNVSNVTNMHAMFSAAHPFNQDLSSWDTGTVTDMRAMFSNAAFNQDIGNWNVSNVLDMTFMFLYNYYFNQDLSGWCVFNIPTAPNGFDQVASSYTEPRPVWGTCPFQ